MALARPAHCAPESLICNPNAIGVPIGPPLGPHWPLVQPILPILRIPAGALGVPKPCGLDFSRFFIDFALKTSTTLPQILLKINSFNVVFKDAYKIADFEKHRKNLGFSQVFLGF